AEAERERVADVQHAALAGVTRCGDDRGVADEQRRRAQHDLDREDREHDAEEAQADAANDAHAGGRVRRSYRATAPLVIMRSMRVVLEPAPGARIVADHLPGDAPALVFLHGLVSVRRGEKSTALFDLAARTGRAAWRFDFRGHGESSGVLHDTTLTELIADARSVLEASGPAFLVGSSLGGLVAAWTAARHPEFVRGLVLLAPALRFLPRLIARSRADGTIVLDHGVGELRFSER